jgi:hypothetical protein
MKNEKTAEKFYKKKGEASHLLAPIFQHPTP